MPYEIKPQREQWLQEALDQIPEGTHDKVLAFLTKQLKRCHSKSKHRFWLWLRLTLAKVPESAELLTQIREPSDSRPKPFSYVENGDTALIDLGSCIWKLPLTALPWAESLWPVFARELPPLEPPEHKQLRDLKRRFRQQKWKMRPAMREQFQKTIAETEARLLQAKATPATRYAVFKNIAGVETAIHRLYVNAAPDQDVAANDGDLTNYGFVKARKTVEPVYSEGVGLLPGNEDPAIPTRLVSEVLRSNLYIVQSCDNPHLNEIGKSQAAFDERMLQMLTNDDGDTVTKLPIQPNADLGKRTGVCGLVMDCGQFESLNDKERAESGLLNLDRDVKRPEREIAEDRNLVRRLQDSWGIFGLKNKC
jgi:hypothetical protein